MWVFALMALVPAVRHLVGHVADGVVGGRGADALDAVLGEPAGAREPGARQAALAEHGGQARVVGRALLVLGDVFLAGPDHFHGPLELLRELGRLAGDAGAAAAVAAEAAAEEHGVDVDVLRVAAGLVGGEL